MGDACIMMHPDLKEAIRGISNSMDAMQAFNFSNAYEWLKHALHAVRELKKKEKHNG